MQMGKAYFVVSRFHYCIFEPQTLHGCFLYQFGSRSGRYFLLWVVILLSHSISALLACSRRPANMGREREPPIKRGATN